MKEYLNENGINVNEKILDEILNTKVQIGLDKEGNFKFFDYEDAKIDHEHILEMFRMNEDYIDRFFEYVKQYDINKIKESETFEDHKGNN